jgi:glycosyltransferase involved in cell wall biosynthesis
VKRTITAAWNVRNEEILLGYSIMSVKNIADEFIVVDHASVDRTLKVVKQCEMLLKKPIRVIHLPADREETEAKNIKFKEAKMDWVLWLDADEIFTYNEAAKIPVAIEEAEKDNRVGIYLFMLEFVNDFYTTCSNLIVPEIGGAGQGHRPRVFKKGINMFVDGNWRRSKLHINGKIHQEAKDKMLFTKILVYHYDRLKTNKKERYDKVLYHVSKVNYRLSLEQCKRIVDDPSSHYYHRARNIDGCYKFTGEQPEVFKEYYFYNLDKMVKRCKQ